MRSIKAWKAPSALAAGVLAALAVNPAVAGGQYVVDDAELIDPRSCEVEVWHTNIDGGGYGTFVSPTCRLDSMFQATFTAGFLREDGENEQEYGIELKTLFYEMDRHGYGLGLVVGTEYLTESSRWETLFANAPFSMELVPDQVMFHANVGVERDRGEDDRTAFTWGLGTEVGFDGPVGLVAEVFGDSRSGSDPVLQIGPRFALLDDRLVLDLTYGRELTSGGEKAYSVGVSFVAFEF